VNIVYLCPDPGIPIDGHKGAAAHVRGLVAAFGQLGHDVTLVTPAPGSHTLDIAVVTLPIPASAEAVIESRHKKIGRALRHTWLNVAIEQALTDLNERQHVDLIYERLSPFSAAGALTAERHGVPHMLEVNAPLAWEGARYRRQALQEAAEALEEVALAATSRILAVSGELRDLLVAQGAELAKIDVVPNGVDAELCAPHGAVARARVAGEVVLGFVGSLKEWHGIDVLADAFRALADDPRFHLLVVGDGPLRKIVTELADALPGRVTMTGAVTHAEVPAWLRSIDVALAPYPVLDRFYYSPLKVLEYMAAGCATVASAIGQVPELVRDGATGLLVPPGDRAALVAAIRRLADDDALRRRLGATATRSVTDEHTWVARARQILARTTAASRATA